VRHENEQNKDPNVVAIDDQSSDGSVSVIHEQLWPAVLSFDENDSEMEDFSRHPDAKLDRDDPRELESRRAFLEEDSIQFPKYKIASLILLWVGLSIIYLLKGDKGAPSLIGLTCEKPGYYALVACQFLWTFGFAIVFAYRAVRRTEARKAVNYPFNENDILVRCKCFLGQRRSSSHSYFLMHAHSGTQSRFEIFPWLASAVDLSLELLAYPQGEVMFCFCSASSITLIQELD
jgi:hypothetical protein